MEELLLNILGKEQKEKGYLSEEFLKQTSRKTGAPISRLWGIATFYFMLRTKKQGKNVIHVCNNPSCFVNGSLDVIELLENDLKIKLDSTTKDKKFSLYATSCIGCCDEAPAMMLNGKVYTKLTKEKVREILKNFGTKGNV